MENNIIYVGIDPGQKGGIGIIYPSGKTESLALTNENLVNSMDELKSSLVMACVEKVNAMPGQGVSSMFTFGKGAGFIEGVLLAYKIPFQLISPQKWKKEFNLNSDKQKSIETCQRLFPNSNLYLTKKCRKPSDGLAESLLMAEYAKRKL